MSTQNWRDTIKASISQSEHADTEFYQVMRLLSEAADAIKKGLGGRVGKDYMTAGWKQENLHVVAGSVQLSVGWSVEYRTNNTGAVATLHVTSTSGTVEQEGLITVDIGPTVWPVGVTLLPDRRRICHDVEMLQAQFVTFCRDPVFQARLLGAGRV